jgi:uncharacterized protein (DUF1778 family)
VARFHQRDGAGLARRAHQFDGEFIRHIDHVQQDALVFLEFNGILDQQAGQFCVPWIRHNARITARVSDNVRGTLEQAAELLGATVNQFVVQTAYQEAQRVIERESVIRLSQKDARRILSLLDDPPKPNKRLKEAVKAFRGSVRA